MVTVKKGDVLAVKDFKSGKRKDGTTYMFCEVKADKGYDKMLVWVDNADTLQATGNMVQIREIVSSTLSHHKYTKKNGEETWADDYSINAVIDDYSGQMPKNSPNPFDGFSKLDDNEINF